MGNEAKAKAPKVTKEDLEQVTAERETERVKLDDEKAKVPPLDAELAEKQAAVSACKTELAERLEREATLVTQCSQLNEQIEAEVAQHEVENGLLVTLAAGQAELQGAIDGVQERSTAAGAEHEVRVAAVETEIHESSAAHVEASDKLNEEIRAMRAAIEKVTAEVGETEGRIQAETAATADTNAHFEEAKKRCEDAIAKHNAEGDKSVKLAAKAAKTSKHWEKVAHATVSVRSDHHRPVLHSPATQRKIAARPPTPDHTVGPSETFKQVIGGAHPDQPLLAGTAHVQNDLRFKDVEARVAYESWAATKLLEAKQRDQERRKKFEEKQASEKRVKEQKQQTAERTLAASKASQAEYRKQQAAAKAAFEADLAKTGAIIAERRRKSTEIFNEWVKAKAVDAKAKESAKHPRRKSSIRQQSGTREGPAAAQYSPVAAPVVAAVN